MDNLKNKMQKKSCFIKKNIIHIICTLFQDSDVTQAFSYLLKN